MLHWTKTYNKKAYQNMFSYFFMSSLHYPQGDLTLE